MKLPPYASMSFSLYVGLPPGLCSTCHNKLDGYFCSGGKSNSYCNYGKFAPCDSKITLAKLNTYSGYKYFSTPYGTFYNQGYVTADLSGGVSLFGLLGISSNAVANFLSNGLLGITGANQSSPFSIFFTLDGTDPVFTNLSATAAAFPYNPSLGVVLGPQDATGAVSSPTTGSSGTPTRTSTSTNPRGSSRPAPSPRTARRCPARSRTAR